MAVTFASLSPEFVWKFSLFKYFGVTVLKIHLFSSYRIERLEIFPVASRRKARCKIYAIC